jgi:hypothetical protein
MPQHERGDHLGPVRQVHLGGTLTASSRAATSGLAVSAGQLRNHHDGTGGKSWR